MLNNSYNGFFGGPYGAPNALGLGFYYTMHSDDDFFSHLSEEVKEQVNAHADEFRSADELKQYALNLSKRA
jgi:hypothetical protein